MNKAIIFVCDSRDYHAMDWFHVVRDVCREHVVAVATDILDQSSEKSLIRPHDHIICLYDINKWLFKRQTLVGDIWRNLVKLCTAPLQITGIRKLVKANPEAIFHAHSMYYIFLCWLARIKYVATPMGSDVLIRPDESITYKYLTKKSLSAAAIITVDSAKLRDKVFEISGAASKVIQNGIDVAEISSFKNDMAERNKIVSIRGFYPNYQIEKLLSSRNFMKSPVGVTFIYPFYEDSYRAKLKSDFIIGDEDLGRLTKEELYKLLWNTSLVVSIPESDSSPRSVYEAIFCGCAVAVTYSPWITSLPQCMFDRLIVVDLDDMEWLEKAISRANTIINTKFIPSQEALNTFDQVASMKLVCKEIYNLNV